MIGDNLIREGMPAPGFELQDLFGKTVSLENFRGRKVVLVFIMHLGSLFCRVHLAELRRHYDRIQRLGGEIIVVSFEEGEELRRLVSAHKLPFVFVTDPQKDVYRAYGMIFREKGAAITPKTLVKYVRLRLSGYPAFKKGKDSRQLGGDAVIDQHGIVRFIYRSRFPDDRPGVDKIINALQETEKN